MDTPLANASGVDPREVQTRDDLMRFLSQSLTGEYRKSVGDDEVRSTSTYVKSYLIEVHRDGDDSVGAWRSAGFLGVTRLADRTLLLAAGPKEATYFIDASHPRFQVAHTIDRTTETDPDIHKLTSGVVPGFDRVWMPAEFLRNQRQGRLTGFSFRFQGGVEGVRGEALEEIDESTGEILPLPPRSPQTLLRISEEARAESDYHKFLNADVFRGRKALENIQFTARDKEYPDEYTLSTVYKAGKIIGQGTSASIHFLTVSTILQNYERVIARIENDLAVGWTPRGDSYAYRGVPFEFLFPSHMEVTDLGKFVDSLFRSTQPFRLFGIPHRQTANRTDVAAIDLHSGDPVSFEVTRRWIRLYLPVNSCGNIVARFYTNLQHSLNSEISLSVDGGDPFREG